MTIRTNRRAFLEASLATGATAWASRADAQGPAGAAHAPRLRFAAIGLNHGHITGQCEAVIRGGGELVSFYAKEADLAAAFAKRFPQARLARSRARDPRGRHREARRERGDPERARCARHRRHAPRQGLHVRQAGHDDARATGRGAPRPGRDEAHLFHPLQRAPREPGDDPRRGAGRRRRDRPGRSRRSVSARIA